MDRDDKKSSLSGLAPQLQLTVVAEKTLAARCEPGTLAYCPTMDLVALIAEDKQLYVFRLNGQRVFGGSLASDSFPSDADDKGEFQMIRWKTDGHLLAVAGADDKIRIISSYSGKTVHQYLARPQQENSGSPSKAAKITCLGWGINITDSKTAGRHLQDAEGQIFAEDLLAPDTHPAQALSLIKADLPRELALLDIETSLPKLSTLPGTGSDEDIFSSRASLDAIFHTSNKNSRDAVDVLLVGFDDGTVHLRIFDCFEIGAFPLSDAIARSDACRILLHGSHPMSSTHLLVIADHVNESQKWLKLVTLDLCFITKSGRYLSLLASKTTQLQNLLRYISQVQRQIQTEWKNAQDLPARYIRNANEDLQEKCYCNFITAAYHLVATGNCFEPLKEFLVDIVGERGHKRWEKTVSTGYENVRKLTHESLLPALERCEVILSRLIGLSKFHTLSHALGLEIRDLREVVDTIDCLHLLSHKTLIHSSRELGEFLAFSKWLRHEIDVQSAEPMSQTLDELMEKSDMIDHGQVLSYIQGALTKSVLRNFIQPHLGIPGVGTSSPPSTTNRWTSTRMDPSFYETYKKRLAQLEQQGGRDDLGALDLPKLNDLIGRLGLQCDQLFGRIALAQRRGVLHRCPLTLHPDCDESAMDVAILYETLNGDPSCFAYIAARSRTRKFILYIYRGALSCVNGVSSMKTVSIAPVSLQEGEVRQIQFVEDHTVMLLWSDKAGRFSLLNISFSPYLPQSSTADRDPSQPFSPTYVSFDPNNDASLQPSTSNSLNLSPESNHTGIVYHTFPSSGPKAKPIRINVNGRKERRVVCVLYADGLRYDVFDLDTRANGGEAGAMAEGDDENDQVMTESYVE